MEDINTLIAENLGKPLELLKALGGYYLCPKDKEGNRKGPLVGYAGTYPTDQGTKQYVGDIYANFALAEEHPMVMHHYTAEL